MFAADAELDVGAGRPAALDRDLHELADALLVEGDEGIGRQKVLSQIRNRYEKAADAPYGPYAASLSNCSASDRFEFRAYFACPLRIMWIISIPPRITRALAMN